MLPPPTGLLYRGLCAAIVELVDTNTAPVTVEQYVKIDYCLKCQFLCLDKTPAFCATGERPGPDCSFNGDYGDPAKREWD